MIKQSIYITVFLITIGLLAKGSLAQPDIRNKCNCNPSSPYSVASLNTAIQLPAAIYHQASAASGVMTHGSNAGCKTPNCQVPNCCAPQPKYITKTVWVPCVETCYQTFNQTCFRTEQRQKFIDCYRKVCDWVPVDQIYTINVPQPRVTEQISYKNRSRLRSG